MSSDQMTSSALKKRRLHETTISENRSPDSDGDSDSDSGAGGGGVSGGKASLLPTTPSAVNTTNGDISQGDISFDSTGIPKKPIRPREKRSEVWNYFEVQEINSNGQIIKVGKCKNCPFYGKYSSSTSFMKEHLRKCKGLHGLNPTLTTPGGTLVSVLLDPAAIATAATTTTTTTTTTSATTAPEPMVTVVEEGHPNPVDAIEGKLITPNKPKRNVRAKIARKSGANENENDLAALTAAASAATPATSSSSSATAGSASRKEKFNASDKNFDWGSVWEALTDVRRAQYPKAMSALLEELGVFEVNDLKSLDYDQIELLSSLLKSAPKKAFFELLKL